MSYPERIVPDETEPGVVALHVKRYDFARRWCAGRDVLDAACGVGYGSALLGQTAASVIGVDVDVAAIDYAKSRYAGANVKFAVMNVDELALPDEAFDVVCSFETIEHVDGPERMLVELVRVLRRDGVLVVSTPRVSETTTRPANPFHRTEYSPADFTALLERHFRRVELYGQRRLQTRRHRLLQRLDLLGLRKRLRFLRRAAPLVGTRPVADLTIDDVVIEQGEIERASELVAVCSERR
jgi:SAM-dependent methyltransferase